MFRNTQCTSMAYQSLAYKKVIGEPDTWNYRDIDAILQQGHLLHTHFRNVMKLSINEDNRIAVHELPSSYEIQVLPPSSNATPSTIPEGGKVKMTSSTAIDGPYAYASQEIADSFGNIAPEFPIFLLQTFTTDNADEVNIILTIGDFSMALWRRRNDNVIWLFDSHRRASTGLRHIVPIWESDYYDNGAALARSFTRVSELLEHITELYGENFLYNVRFFNLEMVEDNNAAVAKTDADENGVDVTICDKETSPESSRSGTSFEGIAIRGPYAQHNLVDCSAIHSVQVRRINHVHTRRFLESQTHGITVTLTRFSNRVIFYKATSGV
ncbi:uncharacterized protein LOC132559624 [Ylistrum balloti]|uniref:uncharacterized protein LOC132559624 n=1 Tax=Ylistrum balloti TaxID=509963 RepID=UPI002905C747|nr:uncharacterized protein LOC132559624 [Ylistrum balloti]